MSHSNPIVEAAIRTAVNLGVKELRDLAKGHLPVTPSLESIATGLVEAGIRELLKLVDIVPRVDVVAGKDAVVTVHIHTGSKQAALHDSDDPGTSPDVRPL